MPQKKDPPSLKKCKIRNLKMENRWPFDKIDSYREKTLRHRNMAQRYKLSLECKIQFDKK